MSQWGQSHYNIITISYLGRCSRLRGLLANYRDYHNSIGHTAKVKPGAVAPIPFCRNPLLAVCGVLAWPFSSKPTLGESMSTPSRTTDLFRLAY